MVSATEPRLYCVPARPESDDDSPRFAPPDGAPPGPWTSTNAYRWCERMAATHYENFPVASKFLPAHLRPHIAAIYAFARTADDFEAGTAAAACGGVTTICDYAWQAKGQTLAATIETWKAKAAGRAHVDYAFHLILSDVTDERLREIPAIVDAGYPSFKVFTIREFGVTDEALLAVFKAARAARAIVNVHAENSAILDLATAQLIAAGRWDPREGAEGLKRFEEDHAKYNFKGVKLYTAEWYKGSRGWRLDDPAARPFLDKCVELGIKNIHLHKGPTIWPLDKDAFDVSDVDKVATRYQELNFIVEHVGLPRIEDFCFMATQERNVYAGLAVVIGATLASLAESALGATLEAPGILDNDALNFVNSALGAGVALAVFTLV